MARVLADLTPLRRSPEFRRLWWGLGLANIGTMLTATAVGLQVYELTHSSLSVGLLGAVGLVPVIVLGLYGGSLADRHDRRRVALVASVVMWAATLGIVAQAWADLRQVWLLYALVAVQAGASAINGPARSAIIPRLVSLDLMPAATALNMMTATLASLAGPMVGASLVALVGFWHTYVIDAVTFTFALYAILRLPPIPPLAASAVGGVTAGPVGWIASVGGGVAGSLRLHTASVLEGVAFLRTRHNIQMTFLVDLSAMILAYPTAAFPAAAAVILGGGQTTAGVLTSAIAVGALLAAVLSGSYIRVRRQGWAVVLAVTAWGAGVAGCGAVWLMAGRTSPTHLIVPALVGSVLVLAFAGGADAVSSTFRNTILQVATPDDLRGRLQGVFLVVVTGGPRLGQLVSGTLSSLFGEGSALVAGGLGCVVAVWLLALWRRSFLAYDGRQPVA